MSVLRRGLFLFFFALSLFDASVAFAVPGICRDTLARVSPSIENLFDTAVLINDVSASLRERPVNDLRVVRISDIFPGENEVILGFGKPNVYLMVPRAHQQGSAPPSEKDRYIKFAGKSLKRDVSKIEDTRGFIQSGVLLRFRDLPPESVGKLREAMEKHHGKKYWTCVNVNCRILESAGFSGGDGKPLSDRYFPVSFLRMLIRDGLMLDGKKVEFDLVRTTPVDLEHYGIEIIKAEANTLGRHFNRALSPWLKESGLEAVLAIPRNAVARVAALFFRPTEKASSGNHEPSATVPEPVILGAEAERASVGLRVSNTDQKGTLLRLLWGPHNLFEARPSGNVDVNGYLPETLKAFPKENPSLFTKLKQSFLFSPTVVRGIRQSLARQYTDIGEQSVRTVYDMIKSDSPDRPFKYNIVITGDRVIIARLNVRAKSVDWVLTKHVLMSGYDPDVRFAGEIWKDPQGRIHLNNNSGTYLPSAEALEAAGAYLRSVFPGVPVLTEPMAPKPAVPPSGVTTAAPGEGVPPARSNPVRRLWQTLKGFDTAYPAQMRMVREIAATTREKRIIRVPLSELQMLHPMQGVKEDKVEQRARVIEAHTSQVLEAGVLSVSLQDELVPSKAPMSVIRDRDGKYVLFDGNGRFKSIRKALAEHPDLQVEVQLHDTPSEKVLSLLDNIRRKRGLASTQ